jgi:hypothetical protein
MISTVIREKKKRLFILFSFHSVVFLAFLAEVIIVPVKSKHPAVKQTVLEKTNSQEGTIFKRGFGNQEFEFFRSDVETRWILMEHIQNKI